MFCFAFYFYVVACVYALVCYTIYHSWALGRGIDIYINMVDGHVHKLWLIAYMVRSIYSVYIFIHIIVINNS